MTMLETTSRYAKKVWDAVDNLVDETRKLQNARRNIAITVGMSLFSGGKALIAG